MAVKLVHDRCTGKTIQVAKYEDSEQYGRFQLKGGRDLKGLNFKDRRSVCNRCKHQGTKNCPMNSR